jgi:A/G-specific adenine glycosylase
VYKPVQKFPIDVLKGWFLAHQRNLPWRILPTPYRVWISEVMLQQTQVAVVIPYFEKWMEMFPSIEALSLAPFEQVIKCWEGLGYYSRARNLHLAAKKIVAEFGGEMPSSSQALAKIPGIGPYTQGALLSFAFHQKAAAVDGNVLRVLSRFLACLEPIDVSAVKKRLQAYAEAILPHKEPWLISEGLIELGALVCTKKAKCGECPLRTTCRAYQHRLQDKIPCKKATVCTIELERQVAVIHHQGRFMIQKREKGEVMADLYEFPYIELPQSPSELLVKQFEKICGMRLQYAQALPVQKHTFTRYRARLFPHLLEAEDPTLLGLWKTLEEIKILPFSSGHKRILAML